MKMEILSAPPTHADGITLGESPADKAGLFGNAIVQPSGATQAAVTATPLVAAAGDAPTKAEYGTVVAQVNALTVLVNSQRAALVALGAIKGSA